MKFNTEAQDKDASLEQQLKVSKVRLSLAQSFVDLVLFAFDALKTHGIDYRELPSYKDTTLLDDASKLPIDQGHDSFITWMGRIRSDIHAAVRRKGFRKV